MARHTGWRRTIAQEDRPGGCAGRGARRGISLLLPANFFTNIMLEAGMAGKKGMVIHAGVGRALKSR